LITLSSVSRYKESSISAILQLALISHRHISIDPYKIPWDIHPSIAKGDI
jgi:hypothetical protein